MTRVQLYLPAKLYAEIKRLAAAEKLSAAEAIRRLLSEAIQARQTRAYQQNGLDELLHFNLVGGPGDLSVSMDRYLHGDR